MEVLTAAEFFVVQALNNAFPNGLSWPDLAAKRGCGGARTTVIRLKAKHRKWDATLKLPGENPHGDCRIVAC